VSDNEVLPAMTNDCDKIPKLLKWIEESDARQVVRMEWAVPVKQCKRVGVVSNDTATFVLLLHYTPYFQALELNELWQLYSTDRKRHMLPVHQEVSRHGERLTKAVNKAHVLTGD